MEIAKQMAERTSRNPKDFLWLGVRMENFQRAYGSKIDTVSATDICDYLEGLVRKNQAEWQIKQSLEAIAMLMRNGYHRKDLEIWDLREAWGTRLNQRAGIVVPVVQVAAADGVATVTDRLRRQGNRMKVEQKRTTTHGMHLRSVLAQF